MVVKRETGKESSLYNSNDRDQYHNISCPFLSRNDRRWNFHVSSRGNVCTVCLRRGNIDRLFTSMFLHFGFEHLMNNMFILGVIGWNLELEIGKWKYLAVYLLSGLMGNLLSAWMDIQTGEYAISAGASGQSLG